MHVKVVPLTAGLLLAIALAAQQAWAQHRPDDYRRSMGNLRPDSYTAGRAVQGSDRFRPRGRTTVVVPSPYYYGSPYPYYAPYPSYYPGGYGYYPYYVSPYSYYGPGYIYPPPVLIPPETLYGPRAVRRFMGAPW
jgi:hypothetical protein